MTDHQPIRVLATTESAKIIAKELTRRRFLNFSVVAAGAGLLAACSSDAGGSGTPGANPNDATGTAPATLEDELSIYTWADYDAPETLTDFTDELGPKVIISTTNSDEEMISKIVASKGTGGFDIVVLTGVFIPEMVHNGLLRKLDHSLIPNLKNMDPAFLGQDWDPNNEYSICKNWGSTGFVYDKTKITRELHTWADFHDAAMNEASGSVSMLDEPASLTGSYFWANGVEWTTTDTSELDACEDFIVNKLAPHVSAWDSYPVASIAQGTHALIQAWNGEARLGILESEDPDRWQWRLGAPETEIWMGTWSILADAPHPEAAHAFLNYVLRPEVSLQELAYIGFHTGIAGIEEEAKKAEIPMLDLIFFTPEQIATMKVGAVNEAKQRTIDIYSKAKAAAGA